MFCRIIKCKFGNASGLFCSDHFQAFHHSGNRFMFQCRVFTLSLFPHNNQIDIFVLGRNARQTSHFDHISIQVQFFTEPLVDVLQFASKVLVRNVNHTLDTDAVLFDTLLDLFQSLTVPMLDLFNHSRSKKSESITYYIYVLFLSLNPNCTKSRFSATSNTKVPLRLPPTAIVLLHH